MPLDLSELKGRLKSTQSTLASQIQSARQSHAPSTVRPPSLSRPPISTPSESPSRSASTRFTADDKAALFDLLDGYFTHRNSGNLSPRPPTQREVPSAPIATPSLSLSNAPPPVNEATRPRAAPSSSSTPTLPPTITAIAPNFATPNAQILARFFNPSTSWAASPSWFAFDALPPGAQPTPPSLSNRSDVIRSSSWSYTGSQKTVLGIALFEDLSIVWYRVKWNSSNFSGATRDALWSAPPSPWSGGPLYDASCAYGDFIADFAERAEAERRHVGRGECWDLANDALKHVGELATSLSMDKPMPCIGKTHGHLIYWAKAGPSAVGTWRGGDIAVRRGDIVQWLRVKIKPLGQPFVTMTLGEPDHTAIIVADSALSGLPDQTEGDGGLRTLRTNGLGSIEVVEQSVRELPTRRTYDMSQFLEGEVWIYRPVSMLAYLGISDVSPNWPPPIPRHQLNEG